MLRRVVILALPALALIAWLIAAQLPRWTAPQPGWFAPETPGVCAAVASLVDYQAARIDPPGIGRDQAKTLAARVATAHYDAPASDLSDPLAVSALLPGQERRAYYVVTARLGDDALAKAAVIYLDATDSSPRAVITALDAGACDFDVRAALKDALRSPPALLLAAYIVIAAAALIGWRLLHLRGRA